MNPDHRNLVLADTIQIMNKCVFIHMAAMTLSLGWTGMGLSSECTQALRGVDQAVTDQDRLGMSLRQVESGLGTAGQQSALFLLSPPVTPSTSEGMSPLYQPRYLRLDLGLRATTDRIDYVVPNPEGRGYKLNQAPSLDGEFYELVGPNTVFELQPILPQTSPWRAEPPPDARINARVEGRLQGHVQ